MCVRERESDHLHRHIMACTRVQQLQLSLWLVMQCVHAEHEKNKKNKTTTRDSAVSAEQT